MNGIRWAVVLALCLLASHVNAAPVGMICNLKGDASVNGDPARVLKRIAEGDNIVCKPGGEVTVVLFGNGERFRVTQRGTVKNGTVSGGEALGGLKGPSAEAVRTLGGSRVGATLSRDPMPTSRILGVDPDWVSAETQAISWKSVPEAKYYIFSIYDTHDDAVFTARTNGPVAQLNLKSANLTPGQTYVWKLTARNENGSPIGSKPINQSSPPVRWGTLAVMTQKEVAAMTAATRDLINQTKSTGDKSYGILLAGVYRSYNLLKLALEALDEAQEIDAQKDLQYDLGNIGWFYSNPGVQPLRE